VRGAGDQDCQRNGDDDGGDQDRRQEGCVPPSATIEIAADLAEYVGGIGRKILMISEGLTQYRVDVHDVSSDGSRSSLRCSRRVLNAREA
jgi:hypothetical protein